MSITLGGQEIIAFLTLIFLIGPSLIYVGSIATRVKRLEKDRDEDRTSADVHREALWNEIRAMRGKVDSLYGRFIGDRRGEQE